MPVIVVGADTASGAPIISALLARGGEVRAFVGDPDTGLALKQRGVKVAVGDVSDASHVGGAALEAFCAVLVADAADDGRERSFAADASGVFAAWAEALADAGVQRAIVVGSAELIILLQGRVPEVAGVASDLDPETTAAEVARLEDLAEL